MLMMRVAKRIFVTVGLLLIVATILSMVQGEGLDTWPLIAFGLGLLLLAGEM